MDIISDPEGEKLLLANHMTTLPVSPSLSLPLSLPLCLPFSLSNQVFPCS